MIKYVKCQLVVFENPDLPTALRQCADWIVEQNKIVTYTFKTLDITVRQPDDYNNWIVNLYW